MKNSRRRFGCEASELSLEERKIARRDFLGRSVLGTAGLVIGCSAWPPAAGAAEVAEWLRSHRQRTPLAAATRISDVSHIKICYDPKRYCAHPRQGIFKYFGDGEIIVGHKHAPCKYKTRKDVSHATDGYHSRSKLLLQRSLDGGQTWPEDQDVVVYDETISPEAKRAFLYQKNAPREQHDMFRPESVFYFGRTNLPERDKKNAVCFALRSADKGHTWEKVPTIIENPGGAELYVHKDCHPVVRMPDGKTLLAAMSVGLPGNNPAIYASTDNGLSWSYWCDVVKDLSGIGRFTYAGLLLLPGGRLQCYTLHITGSDYKGDRCKVDGLKDAICVCNSTDGGHTWSEPAPIVGKGISCWKQLGERAVGSNIYRSPWPMLLSDGRVLVIFARRRFPYGIGGTISEDGGKTWSEEFVIRAGECSCWDLGYPVACQLEDGRVFSAYYYNTPDGTYRKAVRYIAGTTFRLA
jgi:hypothetical protein